MAGHLWMSIFWSSFEIFDLGGGRLGDEHSVEGQDLPWCGDGAFRWPGHGAPEQRQGHRKGTVNEPKWSAKSGVKPKYTTCMRWDEMGWNMNDIDELQQNVNKRLHLAPFGFPLKDLKLSMMHSGFCPLSKDSAAEKAKKFNDDWLSVLGVQKGLTGLAKDSSWLKMLTYHSRSAIGALMFAIGSTFTVKAVDTVSQLMTIQFQLTQDFTMNYLGREGASTPFENPPRVTFFCWKGYHNSNGPLVDAIKEVRQYGKCWQMSFA